MRTIRTPSTRAKFLEALEQHGNVTNAALVANIGRSALYAWKAEDADFSNAWEAALQLGVSSLEDHAMDMARAGSEKLTMFMLSSLRPEKYGNRQTLDVNQNVSMAIRRTPLADLKAELDALIQLAITEKPNNVITLNQPDED